MDINWVEVVVALLKCTFSLAFVMQVVPILIWGERKLSAYIQDRTGPNRAHVGGVRAAGLVHTLNDVVKLVFKEDIIPDHVDKRLWFAAPVIAMSVALTTFTVVPWGDHLMLPESVTALWGGQGPLEVPLQVAQINGGMLFILAIGSLGVYGVMLAGWASNNKYALLGGLRASAQMVSYELAMGLAVVAMFMLYGTTRLDHIAAAQSGPIWNWGVFGVLESASFDPLVLVGWIVGLLAFILFWTSVFAETNRMPFDLPEGEAELVAGYHIEYSSLRFALFFMAEYAHMVVGSAVTATLFFGGYNIPFLDGAAIRAHTDMILLGLGAVGVPASLAFAVIAWRRRTRPFYKSLAPGDIRHREPKFWIALWTLAALAALGVVGLGLSGVVGGSALGPELLAFALQTGALFVKVLIGTFFMIWVRWTIPRFRYDQLMDLGWRTMLPLAIGTVMLAGVWVIVRESVQAI
jgi:NADH-quinone oxidoreductase subunit H